MFILVCEGLWIPDFFIRRADMKRARRILNPILNEGNQAMTTTRINATASAPWKFPTTATTLKVVERPHETLLGVGLSN